MTPDENLAWFDAFDSTPQFEHLKSRPIAYFCAEYALASEVPTYSGGLGILAGDVIREAADRNIPMIAVGLYYREGFLCEIRDVDGRQMEVCDRKPPERFGLVPVVNAAGEKIVIKVPIQDRDVLVQAWEWKQKGIRVLLLDTDIEANADQDRRITDRLYVDDKETRLKQEIILGIGGLRVLEALAIHPSTYHLNEGHSAMLALELIRHQMQERKIGFDEAKQFAKRRIVLSNHTLVPAGNEVFSNDLAATLLARYAEQLQVPAADLVKLGLVQESSIFSMTMLAFRMSSVINSVSKLHARKAKEIWTDHPMVAVTNGIHVPTWDRIREGDIGDGHRKNKRILLDRIMSTGRDWSPDHLLLGWARRIVQYKRPMAVLEDLKRFGAIARSAERPVRVVFAGHPHPSDADGIAMLQKMKKLIEDELSDIAVFLPSYSLSIGQDLVAGCDVWLNTPTVGFEACGTSGMKAALNGVLPCSTKDGWVDEVDLTASGWLLDNAKVGDHLLDLLEKEIVPLYYQKDARDASGAWNKKMLASRQMILDRFTATRMLREYVEMLYV